MCGQVFEAYQFGAMHYNTANQPANLTTPNGETADQKNYHRLKGYAMIVDHIKNHAKYMHLPPRIVHAIQYIGSTDFTFVESGQYELDGKKLVSMVQRYKTKLPEQAIWESHRKYIDVQFVAGGHEQFGHAPLANAPKVKTPYNEERDVIFYEPGTEIIDAPMGTFMIFYPDDIHAPALAIGNPPTASEVVKVVVKVAVEGL